MRSLALTIALAAGLAAGTPVRAAEPYDIHVIVPLTGSGAFLGKGHRDSLDILAEIVNKAGGIKGRPLHFVYHDDQSSPQVAVQLANEVLADKPAVVLGSSLVAMCNAIAPLMKNGPVDYCLSPAVHPEARRFHLLLRRIGDRPDGGRRPLLPDEGLDQDRDAQQHRRDRPEQRQGDGQVVARPENKDVKLVAREHFNPTDISVAAQIERIKASGAQAIVAGVTGTPAATVFKGMVQAGLDIPIAPTSGNEVFAQLDQWSDFLPKGLVIGSSLFPEHDGVWKLDPRVEAAQHEMYAALKKHGREGRQHRGHMLGRRSHRDRGAQGTGTRCHRRADAELYRQSHGFRRHRRHL